MSADGRVRVATDLSSGRLVMLPQARPSGWMPGLGWWSVDPATGWTEDTTEQGGHQELPEEGVKHQTSSPAYRAICQLGRTVFAMTLFVAAAGGAEEGISTETWSLQDAAVAGERRMLNA